MLQSLSQFLLIALGTMLGLPISVALAQDGTVKSEHSTKEVRQRLNNPVSLEKGIEANTPFKDAIEFLSDRYDLPIYIDQTAFKKKYETKPKEPFNPDDQPVRLPRMVGAKLHTVLRLLSEQLGGTYLVRSGHVEITIIERTRPSYWTENKRELAPTVNAEFDKRPLEDALADLADQSGISIVLDTKAAEKAKTALTATFNNVPVDTAVRLLADMADLKMVALDSALYVTTRANAEQFVVKKAEQDKKKDARPPLPTAPPDPEPKKETAKRPH
jgi:hypothetical protein